MLGTCKPVSNPPEAPLEIESFAQVFDRKPVWKTAPPSLMKIVQFFKFSVQKASTRGDDVLFFSSGHKKIKNESDASSVDSLDLFGV